jgi:hypothetical protein
MGRLNMVERFDGAAAGQACAKQGQHEWNGFEGGRFHGRRF